MKTYLITGGCGFIGSNFIHYLIENQLSGQIINLDKLTYAGNKENLSRIEKMIITILLKVIFAPKSVWRNFRKI